MPKETTDKKSSYSAEHITVLEGLDPVRKRPGMYIGSTSETGLHHLIWEIVDNSVDEALAGHATQIYVSIQKDGGVRVEDNGRGIPVDLHKTTKKSALETVLTVLHAGGKFGGDASGYKVSGGLHGVGAAVVNALSTNLIAQVKRDGKVYEQKYKIGKPQGGVKVVGKVEKNDLIQNGTTIIFYPDASIFETIEFKFKTVLEHLRNQAYLTKGLHFAITDERVGLTYQYYFEGGIVSYIRQLNRNKKARHNPIYVQKQAEDILVEVVIQYTDDFDERVLAFANNVYNPDGGMHVTGFRTALTRCLNNYATKHGSAKESEKLTGEDMREGLSAIISVKLPNPQFEGQTKAKLGNPEVRTAVEATVSQALDEYLEEHPADSNKIIEKVMLAAKARLAARAARDSVIRKGVLEGLALPGKLADCSESDPAKCELYIVEGDSAGGCFSGETKVALADGRNINFIELVAEQEAGKENFCYTIRKDGKIGIEKIINVRRTKQNAQTYKLTLDNGESIICTPDHKFMLRDGNYKEAQNLTSEDSLMPLNKRVSSIKEPGITIDGYEMIFDPKSESWLFTHMVSDWYNLWKKIYQKEDGEHRHHIDFNKRNNNPTNLIRITKEQWTNEFRAKRKSALSQTYYRKTIHALKSIQIEKGTIDIDYYNAHCKATKDKSLIKFDSFCERYFNGDTNKAIETITLYNHRVLKIEKLSEKIDVYDLEVPGTHNFALASGVFVHNSAKQGRDRRFQAILPLRGKILNVERARIDRMLGSEQIKNLVIAFGTGVGDLYDITKLRYHRIIIMTDADVDGAHIRTLLLTLFYRYFPELIKNGYLYIAQPPLFRVQVGKEFEYAFSETERDQIVTKLSTKANEKKAANKAAKAKSGVVEEESLTEGESEGGEEIMLASGVKANIQRYKGLGEMNPGQLWETTMDPAARVMLKVDIKDAEKVSEIFETLMGDEVSPRKRFLTTHAKYVKNLDI